MIRDESPSGEFGPPRVLVVDDEPTIRDVLVDFLGLEGFVVHAACDGKEALECLDDFAPQVVLLDLEMPRMNGLELLEALAIRRPEALSIMMTGYGTVETAIAAMKSGAYDYLLKPFKVPDVIKIIERGLEKRRLEQENVKLKELVDLYDASERLGRWEEASQIDDLLMGMLTVQAEADAVSLWRRNEDGHLVRVKQWLDEEHGEATAKLLETLEQDLLGDELTERASVFGPEQLPGYGAEAFSLLYMPVRGDRELLGVVFALRRPPKRRFRESKRKLLSILLDRAAAALDNARLYEDLQQTFKQTIQALANILEDRDPYTRGHSERVSIYARMIAKGLGLEASEVERIADSALMHDIGKLGIRFEELNKADPLTQSEYEMFKSHTTRGKWILEPIKFLHPLIPGVYHHHERWDGKGYPVGLVGEQTPLMARILSVADSYDAMTSHRAYRRALPHDVAMREIENCAGTQFDPQIVHVFLREMARRSANQGSKADRWRSLAE